METHAQLLANKRAFLRVAVEKMETKNEYNVFGKISHVECTLYLSENRSIYFKVDNYTQAFAKAKAYANDEYRTYKSHLNGERPAVWHRGFVCPLPLWYGVLCLTNA